MGAGLLLAALIGSAFPACAGAAEPHVIAPAGPVTATAYLGRGTVVAVPLRIRAGWRIVADPAPEGWTGARFDRAACAPLKIGAHGWPGGTPFRPAGEDADIPGYAGTVTATVAVAAPPAVMVAWHTLDLTVVYQPCGPDGACGEPRALNVPARVRVLPAPRPASARR